MNQIFIPVKIGCEHVGGLMSVGNLIKRGYKLNRYMRRRGLIEEFLKVLTFKKIQALALCLSFNPTHSFVEQNHKILIVS